MKFLAISGSHRQNSQSLKISRWLLDNLKGKGFETDLIDLGVENIPLWSGDAWNKDSALAAQIKPYQERVKAADGLILTAPEWGGMAPAALKNILLYLGSAHCAHKPALIVGVSSSRGGAYPVSELRMSGYKNTRLNYIPEHLIVRDCEKVMNAPELESGDAGDQYIKKRADYTLGVLAAYVKALKSMRETETGLLHPDYPNGM